MKVSGSVSLNAPRGEVWRALYDPAVLVKTIPGCQRLEAVSDDVYAMTLTAGVASVKGVYQGEIRLTDQQPLDTFVLRATGSGAPGTVSADVTVALAETSDATTTLTYDADAVIGGMIGGVGQRMLSAVAKKTAGEFFSAVDDVLTGRAATADGTGSDPSSSAGPHAATAAGVFEAPGAGAALAAVGGGGFIRGALVGAGAALLGAVVGGWLAGRRPST